MKIAVGNSRMDKKWKNRDISWEDLCARVGSTIRTTETVEEYRKLKKGVQDNIKDVGGFVGGQLREDRRKNGMVLCRSMLTLDMDYGKPGVWDEIDLLHDFQCCVYSTHKHTPEHPRLRMIIPLARDITEEEYPAVARMVAKEIGIDLFDDTTYEACRLMYWPSTSANGEFFYKTKDGPLLDPDAYLAKYADWHDASTWPVSSRQSEAVRRSITQQADPLEKPGIVGAFCRAYTIEEAIETFLSDVYEPSSMNGRYDYIPADSAAGVVVYDGKFAYSHHATDPVCGKLLNAFDLVRLHKFRELDENVGLDTPPGKLPSFKAMSDLALGDDKVKTVFAEERIAQASAEFSDEDWQNGLELDKSGHVKNTLHNLTLILENDPNLKGVVFNQLLDGMEIKGEVPWKHPSKFWRDADDAQLISYVDAHYLRDTTGNRRFWPVKTPGSGKKQSWNLTHEEILQIWAEALVYVRQGEKLYWLCKDSNLLRMVSYSLILLLPAYIFSIKERLSVIAVSISRWTESISACTDAVASSRFGMLAAACSSSIATIFSPRCFILSSI